MVALMKLYGYLDRMRIGAWVHPQMYIMPTRCIVVNFNAIFWLHIVSQAFLTNSFVELQYMKQSQFPCGHMYRTYESGLRKHLDC